MYLLRLLAILFIISLSACDQQDLDILDALDTIDTDRKALNKIKSSVERNESIPTECLHLTITRGWKKASTFLIESYFNPREIDLYEHFVKIRKEIQIKQLALFSNLTHLLPENSPFLINVEPCFLWAQNMTHIFMKVKFSSKIDMPGYVEIHRIKVNITLPELFITGYAFTGDSPVKFSLNIKTYKFMNEHGSRWYQGEQGTIVLEILKSPSPYVWRNIHAELHQSGPNQHIWWEIYKQNRDSFEAGFSLLEDTEIKREEKEDAYQLREERIIADKKLVRDKVAQENNQENQYFRDKMYCSDLGGGRKGNHVLDPFDWATWEI